MGIQSFTVENLMLDTSSQHGYSHYIPFNPLIDFYRV